MVSESPNFTFQVCGNCELTANFIPPYSIVTLTDGPGTLTSSTPATGAGKTVTLDPTPDEGCEFLIWVVDGEDVVIDENNTFVMPDREVQITARFGICRYWIAADRNIGGVLFDQNKEWGSEVTVTATEEEGYVFLHWVDEDGTIVSANPQYTFTVRKACTLTAVYTPCYTISFGAGVRGAANGEGPDCAFTVTLGDTTFNDTFGNLTFTDGVAQVTLKNGGTVTVPDMPADVTATVEAIPPEGYVFSGWSGDSGDEERSSSEPVYNFSEYSSGILMTASFEKLYTVTVTDNGHGTAAASVVAACEGTEVTLNETANEGYTFKEWQVISGGVVVHRAWLVFANGTSFWKNSFTLPAADVEIRAVFEKPYAIDTEYCMAWTEDDNGQQLAANWAMPGDTLVLMRDATGQIPNNLYFPNDREAQFLTQGGVTLSWNADRYVWQFVMPESDVGISLVMLERMNPIITLFTGDRVEVSPDVAEGLINRYDPDANPDEGPIDIDLNNDGNDDIRVTYGTYVFPENPQEGEEWTEPVRQPSYVERLAGADAITGDVTVAFADYGYPNDMPYIGCVLSFVKPVFGNANFVLPAMLSVIEESAFEGNVAITVVYAQNCESIGANAFKDCTGLTQIRLPADCVIDATAFSGCGVVQVFAPAEGVTQAACALIENCVFIPD